MTAADVARAKGAELFEFDYQNADVAEVQTFSAGSWGLYQADTVSVRDEVTPDLDNDGVTSLPGSITFSVTLFHLDAFTSSHVRWEGSGVTMEYSLDGTTWLPLDSVIALDGDSDFDIRASFAAGVPGVLTSLTVYIFKSDALTSSKGRIGTFTADAITDGVITLRGGEFRVAADSRGTATPVTAIEFWAKMDEQTGVVVQGDTFDMTLTDGLISNTGCTIYLNGALATWVDYDPTVDNHYIVVPTTASDAEFVVGLIDMTVSHLALYSEAMTADLAAVIYDAQDGLVFRFDDADGPTVTEYDPVVDIYAYAWSVVTGLTT
jgi:hypothetical protein